MISTKSRAVGLCLKDYSVNQVAEFLDCECTITHIIWIAQHAVRLYYRVEFASFEARLIALEQKGQGKNAVIGA